MKNLFIDTNVWLSLYHFSKNDLDKFLELHEFIGSEIKLYLTEQVYDEITRNRENKIKSAMNSFENFNLTFPSFVKEYPEYEPFKRAFDSLKDEHKVWLKKIEKEIIEETTQVDKVIKKFWEGEFIKREPELVEKAKLRYNMGNPPGKDNKYGDAINWEILLKEIPLREDLYFITEDRDFASPLDDTEFLPFLQKEWNEKKQSKVIFFKNLDEFLRRYYNEQALVTENYKNDLIKALENSVSFALTHSIIESLRQYSDFTDQQCEKLFSIANTNNQVNWILSDGDVRAFYEVLLETTSLKETENIKFVREKLEGDL